MSPTHTVSPCVSRFSIHVVREIAYRAMGVEAFDYVAAFTPDRMVEMGTYLATLRNGL